MSINKSKRVLTPIRFYESDLLKVKEKIVVDRITFQKLVEVLVLAYLKDNKHIQSIVQKYADEKNSKKRRYSLTEMESHALLDFLEKEESPLRHLDFEKIAKDTENG